MRLIPTVILCLAIAAPAMAKPALREVKEIDDTLMQIAIADEIRKSCDDIGARMLRALGQVSSLKSKAQSLGYSSAEIDEYVTSKAEKKRMRSKAEAWLASQGVNAKDDAALCAFGHAQIDKKTYIGSLLH
ncbi:DUF5333 domain-containing protein [Sagittula sp. S175]|uniref:DUF5333 domain-containing protein n=1 Tax=Sagittula sp. S175 TaxID=3415129 RepID=UPI003C7B612F